MGDILPGQVGMLAPGLARQMETILLQHCSSSVITDRYVFANGLVNEVKSQQVLSEVHHDSTEGYRHQ